MGIKKILKYLNISLSVTVYTVAGIVVHSSVHHKLNYRKQNLQSCCCSKGKYKCRIMQTNLKA